MAVSMKSAVRTALSILLVYCLLSLAAQIYLTIQKPSDRVLLPRNHVLFVKTHKTGSSTAINLFQRYAYNHGLSVALPRTGDVFLGWPRLLTNISEVVLGLPDGSYRFDYVINHLVYKPALVSPLLSNDHIRVTLVREPTAQLRSSFNYYEILKGNFTNNNVVEAMTLFASDPERFDKTYRMENWFVQSKTRNPQLADLGLKYSDMENHDKVTSFVGRLLNNFDLVMVAEMMDESFLLLKRLLRWDLRDILYQDKYILNYKGKSESLKQSVQQSLFQWNWGDNLLYWRSKERLLGLLRQEPRFNEELSHYRTVNKQTQTFCEETNLRKSADILVIKSSIWTEAFTIDNQYCANFLRNERPFTRLLQHKQRPDIYNISYYKEIENEQYTVT